MKNMELVLNSSVQAKLLTCSEMKKIISIKKFSPVFPPQVSETMFLTFYSN